MRRLAVMALVALIWTAMPFGSVLGQTIRAVEIRGAHRIENDVILQAITSKKGDQYSADALSRDLKAVYQLGYFEDVTVATQTDGSQIVLIITVKERPLVRNVSFKGNSKIETEELEKEIHIPLYSTLDRTKINESVKTLKKRYDKEGFYLVDIQPVIKNLNESEVEIIFDISENRQVKIKRITFLGNKHFSDSQLRKNLNSKEGNLLSFITKAGTYDHDLLASDVQRLIYFYQDNGYLDVKVGAPETYLSVDKKSLYLTFFIAEGDAYTVGDVDVSGDLLFSKAELLTPLTLKKGQLFKRSNLEKDIQTVTEKYSDEGYFYVNVKPIDQSNREKRTVDINLEIEKGLKVYFERINITGNNITRDKVVRRELKVVEGELFNLTRLKQSVESLKRLGYFEDVNPATPRGSSDEQINLNVDVKEKPTGTFTIGAGFSSSDKFLFNAEISKDNFMGLGLKGELSTQLSKSRQLFNLGLTDPNFLDSKYSVGVSAFKSKVQYPNFDRSSIGGELTVGRPIWELITGSVSYQFEQVNISDVDAAVQSFFTDGITSKVSVGLTRDARDNRLFPKKGTFNNLVVELAGGPFQGDNEFFKVRYNTRFFYPIYKDVIFRVQGRIGFIGSVDGEPVPIFERFFLGGINSIRGFKSRSIGPTREVVGTDPASGDYEFIIGGNKELIGNFEIGFPLVPALNIQGVVFFDAGNAYDDGQFYDLMDLKMSFGGGVRWYSPLGPLRFEYGIPINKKPGDDVTPFEFTIGTTF